MNYLHNIEHLTADGEGFIYWKNISVEHYDEPFDEKKLAFDSKFILSSRPQSNIEPSTLIITSSSQLSYMPKLAVKTCSQGSSSVRSAIQSQHQTASRDVGVTPRPSICLHRSASSRRLGFCSTSKGIEFEEGDFEYHAFQSVGFKTPTAGQPEHNGIIYATLDGMKKKFLEYKVVPGEL